MKNKLTDIALNRSKRLNNISKGFHRPLNKKNFDTELKANYDVMQAFDDNYKTTMEMIERFKV